MGLAVTTSMFAFADCAMAQQTGAAESAMGEEITVTARRRDETLIAVPVVVTAVNAAMIENRGIVNLDGLSRVVPQLMVGPQGGSVQGGNISIRGIAGPDSNPFGDQAVSFDIDGIQVAKATVRRMTDFDMAQIEVFKGPQALYFGKNSMAGIVNIRTADPGDHLEVGAKVGYEPNAREIRTEGYVSTPLGNGFGFRLAGQYSHMKGYLIDQTPKDSPLYQDPRNPRTTSYGLRGTLKYDGGSSFDAKLKVSYGKVTGNGPASVTAFTSCPFGARQFSFLPAGADNAECTPGKYNVNAGYGKVLSGVGGTLNIYRPDGNNFTNQQQLLTGLVMHFRPSDDIEITSATGLYNIELRQAQNYENSYAIALPSVNVLKDREFSQEFNIASSFDGPVNFTGGLYFGDTRARTGSFTFLYATGFDLLAPGFGGYNSPAQVNNYMFTQKGQAFSAFLQTSYKPIPEVEISVGGRYTHEKKRLTDVRNGGGIADSRPGMTTVLDGSTIVSVANGGLALDRGAWDDFSPEATINYRPSQNLTLFTSYKHGFLSGGFNSSSVNLGAGNIDLSYRPQIIKGFEGGIKGRALDGALLLNLAAYHYKVSDLQVVNFTNATSTIRNAASSKIDGVEGDFTYRTPLQGLVINGAAAYNRAVYTDFPGAPCYNGETPAEGCTIVGGNPTQNLAGKPVARSPKWNLSGGFSYDTPVGGNMKFGLNGNVIHSSSYLTDATDAPNGRQKAYTLFDASVRLGAEDDTWQVAVIGRNLGDKHYYVASTDVPFTGGGTGTSGGVLGDRFAALSRGREVLLQVSYKFGN
jgi:iron complex outermembrane receptor protein